MEDKGQALITGGQGALALAIAGNLQKLGIIVHSPDRNHLDVRNELSVTDYFTRLSNLDLLVCNAGVIDDELLVKMSERQWDSVLDTNLRGAFLTAKAAAKIMIKQKRGHIIFISSFSAFHPPAGQVNYAAAKSALTGFAKSLAQELGTRNIRVNVIVPGFMETKMTQELLEREKTRIKQKHMLKEFNTTEATSGFLSFLHLRMPHTSGQVFSLDSRII